MIGYRDTWSRGEIIDSKPLGVEYSLTEEGKIITEISAPLFLYFGIAGGYYSVVQN